MHQFSYKPSFDYIAISLLLAGIILIYFGIIGNYDLAYRRLTIIPSPYSKYVMIALGVLLSIWGLKDFFTWIFSIRKSGVINIDKESIQFPKYTLFFSKKFRLNYSDITQLYVKGGDEYSVIIHTKDSERFSFDSNFFKSEGEYLKFADLIEKNYRI